MSEVANEYKNCDICGENIYRVAKKCPKCLSPLTKEGNRIVKINHWAGIVASVTTSIAIVFIAWSNFQTREAIELQEKALIRTDSSFALVREQLILTRESNEIQRDIILLSKKSNREESERFIEENKPILDITKLTCIRENSNFTLFVDITNTGKSLANNIRFDLILKGKNKIDTMFINQYRFDRIISNKSWVQPILFPIKEYYVGKITGYWSWEEYDKNDSFTKYFVIHYASASNICDIKYISINKLNDFWIE